MRAAVRIARLACLAGLSGGHVGCAATPEARPCSPVSLGPRPTGAASAPGPPSAPDPSAPSGSSGPAPCDDGRVCVAGGCRSADTPIATADALRFVLTPTDFAVVASGGSGGGGEALPAAVPLGRASSGTVELLLRYEPSWRDDAEVLSAFVLLDGVDSAMPAVEPVTFEVARIREPWEPSVVSWGRSPGLDLPIAAGSQRARPRIPLRIDVTSVVRASARARSRDHGFAVLARGDDAYGATIVTNTGGPRLEVYVK